MADSGPVLSGAIETERFFGRIEEQRRLHRDARCLVRGWGRSRALCARTGAGKTELLRRWHGHLFREGVIFPFYYTFSADQGSPEALACDFASQFALQALAFRRRDPSLLTRPPLAPEAFGESLRAAWGEGGTLVLQAARSPLAVPSSGSPLVAAALLPQRFAALTGTRVLCLLDDLEQIGGDSRAPFWPIEVATSAVAPLLLAIEDEAHLSRLFGRQSAAAVTLQRLGPLSPEAATQLARYLARTAGLELDGPGVAVLAREAAGWPFYIGALVRAVAELPAAGPEDIVRAAVHVVCDGELARYWFDRLAGAIPERRVRATALEILAYCLRDGEGAADAGHLASLMLKPEAEIEAALLGLCRAGIARVDCSRIFIDEDPVFRDAVTALYRREFGGAGPGSVAAALAAEKIRGAPAAARRRRQSSLREALRTILEAWEGQLVPAVLFDAAAFHQRHAAVPADKLPAALAGEAAFVTLPRVIGVASGRVGDGASLAGLEVDALAWALRADTGRPEDEVAWVVRSCAGGAAGAEQLEDFERAIAAMQAAGDLPAERLVRWAVLDAPLDQAGEQTAARLRLSTSTLEQLGALALLLGKSVLLPEPLFNAAVAPGLEMEMVIPRATDAELVAARALEQLAENLELEPGEIAKLKMALVEACINAFEHSGDRGGRVRLTFAVEARRLLIRVENRGRTIERIPALIVAGETPRQRGWGLTLIRDLVDEVILEPREDGVSLLMIKNLQGQLHG